MNDDTNPKHARHSLCVPHLKVKPHRISIHGFGTQKLCTCCYLLSPLSIVNCDLTVVFCTAGTELVLVPVHVLAGDRVHQGEAGVHRAAPHPHRHLRRHGPPPQTHHLRRGHRKQTEYSHGKDFT